MQILICQQHGWVVMPFRDIRRCQGCNSPLYAHTTAVSVPRAWWVQWAMYAWWNEVNRLSGGSGRKMLIGEVAHG